MSSSLTPAATGSRGLGLRARLAAELHAVADDLEVVDLALAVARVVDVLREVSLDQDLGALAEVLRGVLGGGAEDRDVDVVDLLAVAEAVVDGHHETGAGLARAGQRLRVACEVALQGDAVLADHVLSPPVGQLVCDDTRISAPTDGGVNLESRSARRSPA